jgi:GNAT superfamily N-acetyltransferase
MTMKIKPLSSVDYASIMDVVNELPLWFDEDARQRAIPVDLHFQDGFVALDDDQVLGFVTFFVAEGRVTIGWMGVRPSHHRRGIGGALLKAVEKFCRSAGIGEIATYTLGDAVDYEPYEGTRAFYFKHGFHIYQRAQTDNPGCPEEIKIKKRVM